MLFGVLMEDGSSAAVEMGQSRSFRGAEEVMKMMIVDCIVFLDRAQEMRQVILLHFSHSEGL